MLRWQVNYTARIRQFFIDALGAAASELAVHISSCGPDDDDVPIFGDISWISSTVILREIGKMLEAEKSDLLYMPTDYHFLILNYVLFNFVKANNDLPFSPEYAGGIDFDMICDMYFWDDDFLIPAEIYNNLTIEQKEEAQFSDELFGVVNKMIPHDDELVLSLVEDDEREIVESVEADLIMFECQLLNAMYEAEQKVVWIQKGETA